MKQKVTADELREYRKQGLLIEEIAALKGMQPQSVKNALRKHKISTPRVSRKWAVPWKIRTEDNNDVELRYLWILAAVADGDPRDLVLLTTARNWASAIIEDGKDIRYDRNEPQGQRWITFAADPQAWHIKMVLESAKARRRMTLEEII